MAFRIAETLGYTVAYVESTMQLDEFYGWAAWFELKHDAEKKAMKSAPKGRR